MSERRGIGEEDCDSLLGAFDLYTTILQLIRSCLDADLDPAQAPPGLNEVLRQAVGSPDIGTVTSQLQECQSQVREIFVRLIG